MMMPRILGSGSFAVRTKLEDAIRYCMAWLLLMSYEMEILMRLYRKTDAEM
jgi:hypothetical protein